ALRAWGQGMKILVLQFIKGGWVYGELLASGKLEGLERRDSKLISDSLTVFLRDVYDHITQIIDITETLRDMLSEMLDVYLSVLSNRINEVMKVLTIITTIFIPLSFIAGIYGMNFKHMPELDWSWGYPATLMVMFFIGFLMLAYFKRKRWF
ncbi:MAG: cob(I)yrinic acid a,c-diamide adenosyltransferase, partial [Firmicutes bacterium]|nr:cob(I)yrinic acid a,c-diamide adenosyltransferase [Bacillota bacterium]